MREQQAELMKFNMREWIAGIRHDTAFVQGHTLQPGWYKVFKIFLIVAVLAFFWILFGWIKTLIFSLVFLLLALGIHMLYRVKTQAFTHSWLDFSVYEENGITKYHYIGGYYYGMVILSALIAFAVSQLAE
jgi:hypothetical protein